MMDEVETGIPLILPIVIVYDRPDSPYRIAQGEPETDHQRNLLLPTKGAGRVPAPSSEIRSGIKQYLRSRNLHVAFVESFPPGKMNVQIQTAMTIQIEKTGLICNGLFRAL